ncbi:MAG: hypothetical protein KAY13_05785, partial [Zoogloea sp.]|nr:hypothetical protein [Zoogloea sp.]
CMAGLPGRFRHGDEGNGCSAVAKFKPKVKFVVMSIKSPLFSVPWKRWAIKGGIHLRNGFRHV